MVIRFSWSWRECNFLLQLKNSSENSLETFQNSSRHSNILKTLVRSKPAGHQNNQVPTICLNVSGHVLKKDNRIMWLIGLQQMIPEYKWPLNTNVKPHYLEQTIRFYDPSPALGISKQSKPDTSILVFTSQYRKSYLINLWSNIFEKKVLGSMLAVYSFWQKSRIQVFFFKPSLPVLIEERTLMSIRSVTAGYSHNTATSSSTTEEI